MTEGSSICTTTRLISRSTTIRIPIWKRMRDEAPLYYNEKYGFYALSRYEDVARGLPTGIPTGPGAARPSTSS